MKRQKTWTLFLMVVLAVVLALVCESGLAMAWTGVYCLWVIGMACFWYDEGKLQLFDKVKE